MKRPKVAELQRELLIAKAECQLLALLASDKPEFYDPFVAWKAKEIRDRVLAEVVAERNALIQRQRQGVCSDPRNETS